MYVFRPLRLLKARDGDSLTRAFSYVADTRPFSLRSGTDSPERVLLAHGGAVVGVVIHVRREVDADVRLASPHARRQREPQRGRPAAGGGEW